MAVFTIRDFEIHKSYLDRAQQHALVTDIRDVVKLAPLFSPQTAGGKPMSVRMTSAGKYGWFSDENGYRYEKKHPNGGQWPDIPESVLTIWHEITGLKRAPDCCLVNYYQSDAKMGLHQDKDEANFDFPVLSISLGDSGLFRMGQTTKGGSTESIWLESGDIVVMGGKARLAYHGVDRIKFKSSTLLSQAGRLNLTLRVVD